MTPRPLLFATLDGYALEGGYDRAYEPSTCYSVTIALGRHAGPGEALSLWRDYEQVLELAKDMGLDGVRLSAEWARIEPRQGEIDERALERYAQVVRHATDIGLAVTLALVDGCWPSWLGLEAWLLPWVVPHVLEHARRMTSYFAHDLAGVVVFADPDRLVEGGYLSATVPPWRRAQREDAMSARAQIDEVLTLLANDALVSAHLVRSQRTVEVNDVELLDIASIDDCDQLYLRSLVRGVGPTAARAGLLSKHEGHWRVSAPDEVLEALRARER